MKLKVNQRIKVKCHSLEYNGRVGTIESINGEYNYVQLDRLESDEPDNPLVLELYPCEMEEL